MSLGLKKTLVSEHCTTSIIVRVDIDDEHATFRVDVMFVREVTIATISCHGQRNNCIPSSISFHCMCC